MTRPPLLDGWVISFDLWGTLLSYGDRAASDAWYATEFIRVLDHFGHQPAPAAVAEHLATARAMARQQQRMTGAQPPTRDEIDAVLAAFAIPPLPELVEVLDIIQANAVLRACPELLPGARQLLGEVRAAGAWVALTSNTLATPAAVHRRLLADADLLDAFDDLMFSCDLGIAKPRPEIFAAVAAHANVGVTQVLHVGNDWRTDVMGALAAGCRAVFYNPRGKPTRPEASDIRHLAELPILLADLPVAPTTH